MVGSGAVRLGEVCCGKARFGKARCGEAGRVRYGVVW